MVLGLWSLVFENTIADQRSKTKDERPKTKLKRNSHFAMSMSAPKLSVIETRALAEEAFIYGYPLVLMAVSRDVMTTGRGKSPVNRFHHLRTFPDHTFTDVVSPNADTLYSSAWLDVSREPLVLSLPDTDGRYYLMPLLDAWTNVFASPGKRTTGTGRGDYAITGPRWRGELPAGLQELRAPTEMIWLIGRTQTNGKADYAAVNKLQDEYNLTPLNSWEIADAPPAKPADNLPVDTMTSPVDQVARMDARAFFGRFTELLRGNPPYAADAPMLEKLARLGIVPGHSFAEGTFDTAGAAALDVGVKEGLRKLIASAQAADELINGWRIGLGYGAFGPDYALRAKVALVGLGANISEDAVYPMARVDADGNPLNGSHRHVLHFEKDQIPPVNAFWSLTMYNERQAFVENPIGRYAIGDRDKLKFNPDESLDLLIQQKSPGPDRESNWLPAPSDAFNLILRMYWPKREVLDSAWVPPAVTRVS